MTKLNQPKPRVVVALSGGVDSAVAAALLQQQGYNVIGVHIKMWSDPAVPCLFKEDRLVAMKVALKLKIPFLTWDLTKEYRRAVVDYLIREYRAGRTPNPDVMCNQEIKFGVFLKQTLKFGADFLATGHYVKKIINHKSQILNKTQKLMVAKDKNKDQSYFLWTLTQDKLKHCLFPLGDLTKPQVRQLAKKFGLPNATKPDSQGICFIGEIKIKKFLQRFLPIKPGLIVNTANQTVGRHDGLAFYTLGQRQGLNLGGHAPYYVAAKDFKTNRLIVGHADDPALFRRELIANQINWLNGQAPRLPLRCRARVRYRQPLQTCLIRKAGLPASRLGSRPWQAGRGLKVSFIKPQRAVTPGQSVVFYSRGQMLGGGVIEILKSKL